jgi:hypothetical protein
LAAVACKDDLIVRREVDGLDEAAAFKLVLEQQVVQVKLFFIEFEELDSIHKRNCQQSDLLFFEHFLVFYH